MTITSISRKTTNNGLQYEVIGHKYECSGYEFTSPKSLECKIESSPATRPPREIRENVFTKNKVKRFNDDDVIDL